MSNGKPIGLLGGVFDPVHNGHILLARACIESLDLQEVCFIPAHVPPHKTATGAAPAHRLAMLQRALEPEPRLTASDIEIRRGGTSYTIDTLCSLRAAAPRQAFCFILGADAFATLPGWRRWQELTEYAHLALIDRKAPGAQGPAEWRRSKQLRDYYRARACASATSLHQRPAGCIHRADVSVPDISSSRARALLGERADVAHLLPPGVCDYIKEQQLYT